MRKYTTTLTLAFALLASIVAASALYADNSQTHSGAMMGRGMMGDDNSGGGMMGMMKQMNQMMDHCNTMMQSRGDDGRRPNDQWRKPAPSTPDKNG